MFRPGGKRVFPAPFAVFPGSVFDPRTGKDLDQVVVATYFRPASFTGEDLAEITTHGNPVIIASILAILFQEGARGAEPGEFIRRAFLNGKMDLLEIEAVAHMLSAVTASKVQIALQQLDGLPSRTIRRLRERLLDYLTQIEAGLNFPEEAIEDIDEAVFKTELEHLISELERFHEAARQGDLISGGLRLVLVGRPNVGKSSVLNAILGRNRAIVTEIPGTTRDTLEETFSIAGFPVKLIDTAGLRPSSDRLEQLGIDRTRKALSEAFLALVILDTSEPISQEDREVVQSVQDSGKPFLLVFNKSDLALKWRPEESFPLMRGVSLSTHTGDGLDRLSERVAEKIQVQGHLHLEELVFLGAQQLSSLAQALSGLQTIHAQLGQLFHDLLAVELEDAIRHLGRVTGETVDIGTLDRIFERFCIGK